MSIAAIQRPAAIYREEQNFAWWTYALLALMAVLALAVPGWAHAGAAPAGADPNPWALEIPVGLAVGLTLPTILIVGVLRMTTEVTPAGLRVWFGWIPTYRQVIPLASIERVEAVRYRPIAECGGWGIRTGPEGERVLSARGNGGVRLLLSDGSRFLIGSQHPEALAKAIDRALRPDS